MCGYAAILSAPCPNRWRLEAREDRCLAIMTPTDTERTRQSRTRQVSLGEFVSIESKSFYLSRGEHSEPSDIQVSRTQSGPVETYWDLGGDTTVSCESFVESNVGPRH